MSVSEATITALYRYPIKSMAGEALAQAYLSPRGIAGDRAWAVRDEVRGGIRGGKRFGALMNLRARFLADPTETTPSQPARIEFPDGSSALSTDPDIHQRLSDYLGNAVTLWPLLPADALDHYRRGAPEPGDQDSVLRALFARTADEPLPDLSVFPAELFEYESPPGTYFDAFPVLLMSQQGLDALGALAPDSRFDVRRFRPTLMVSDDGEPGYPEDRWVGKQLQIGTAQLQVTIGCPRCVMTTHGFADLQKDPSIMRTLVRAHGGNLGVYATVIQPGTVAVGDRVQRLH